jgi:hypothetical protein
MYVLKSTEKARPRNLLNHSHVKPIIVLWTPKQSKTFSSSVEHIQNMDGTTVPP